MVIGYNQFPMPSTLRHIADGFFREELFPLQENLLGFSCHYLCLYFQRGNAYYDNAKL